MSSLYRINYTLSLFGISNTFLLWSGFWQGSRSSKSKAHILIFNSACWRYLVTFQERPNTQLVRHPFVVVGFVSSRSGLTAGWNLAACTRPYQLYTHSAHNMVRKKHTHTIKHTNLFTFIFSYRTWINNHFVHNEKPQIYWKWLASMVLFLFSHLLFYCLLYERTIFR